MTLLSDQLLKFGIFKDQNGGSPPFSKPLNLNISTTVSPIATKFGKVMDNFSVPFHTLCLLFYLKFQKLFLKLASVSLYCKSYHFRTANINILSAYSTQEPSYHIYVSQQPFLNVKASFCAKNLP